MPKIALDPKTGLPTVNGRKVPVRGTKGKQVSTVEEENEEDEDGQRKLTLPSMIPY